MEMADKKTDEVVTTSKKCSFRDIMGNNRNTAEVPGEAVQKAASTSIDVGESTVTVLEVDGENDKITEV
jgi:hypothetical protein